MTQKSPSPAVSSTGSKTNTASDAEVLALAKRIAKHSAPVQVKVDPQLAKRQLIRLSAQKLLNASSDKSPKVK